MKLIDGSGNDNIVHYETKIYKRVTKSLLATEIIVMVHEFNVASKIRLAENECMTSLYHYKSLQIRGVSKIDSLRLEAKPRSVFLSTCAYSENATKGPKYQRYFGFPHIRTPADAFTKGNCTPALKYLKGTNTIYFTKRLSRTEFNGPDVEKLLILFDH